jgi:hypothetical protein
VPFACVCACVGGWVGGCEIALGHAWNMLRMGLEQAWNVLGAGLELARSMI